MLRIFIIAWSILFYSSFSFSANLIQVYQQGVMSDPTFKQAESNWQSISQTFPLSITGNGVAGTGLTPNIDLNGSIARAYTKSILAGAPNGDDFYSSQNINIVITQPVFNIATWESIKNARYIVKAATATYFAAAQNLILRIANAYFEVLRAEDTLQVTLTQEKQFLEQLVTEEQKFKVGLIAITGVYNAEASYDKSVATEINNRNTLHDRIEDLRAITGKEYLTLNGLKENIPLLIPRPNYIESWVKIAQEQNYNIEADRNTVLARRHAVKQAAYGWMPTAAVQGTYNKSHSASVTIDGVLPSDTDTAQIALNVDFPVFRGGFDYYNTKQSRYNYLYAADQLEVDFRTTVNQTRQAFLGIESGISQIQANKQAIISALNQFKATEAGYNVGTRTMVDVLDSVTQLTQAQQAYANARYDYVLSIIKLKYEAGTLSPDDIIRINHWLGKPITFHLKLPKIRPHKILTNLSHPDEDQNLKDINAIEKKLSNNINFLRSKFTHNLLQRVHINKKHRPTLKVAHKPKIPVKVLANKGKAKTKLI